MDDTIHGLDMQHLSLFIYLIHYSFPCKERVHKYISLILQWQKHVIKT